MQGCENMFSLVLLSKSKFFTRVVCVTLVSHSCRSCVACVALVLYWFARVEKLVSKGRVEKIYLEKHISCKLLGNYFIN